MALIRAIGGGGTNISNLADLTQEIGSITTPSGSFEATEDCILIGTWGSSTGTNAAIYLNQADNSHLLFGQIANKTGLEIGNSSLGIGVVITKGQKIYVRNASGPQYNLHFYKIASS